TVLRQARAGRGWRGSCVGQWLEVDRGAQQQEGATGGVARLWGQRPTVGQSAGGEGADPPPITICIFFNRCSVLSKRWKYLYTYLPRLKFVTSKLLPSTHDELDRNRIIEDNISNVLLSHSGDLKGFSLDENFHEWNVRPIKLCKWVRYAALHNVQHLSLAQSAASLVYFISKCPVLHHLYLEDCVLHIHLGELTISAPNLQTFRLLDHGDWDRE
ncbi:hypothetical protein KI387_001677, partial [Taxus chinensis]